MRAVWLAIALGAGASCSAPNEERPPEFVPDASTSSPRTCAEVRNGTLVQGVVWYDDEPASCGADGQECPVFDVDAFAPACKLGTPFAACQSGQWVVWCNLDGGLPEASAGDAASD